MARFVVALALALLTNPASSQDPGITTPLHLQAPTTAIDTGPCEVFTAGDFQMVPLSGVCQFALTYLHQLPDFICEQTTTSSSVLHGVPSISVMKAEVTYLKGREHYSHITVDGRPYPNDYAANRNPFGFISAGELGSDLVDLFKPSVTEFRFRNEAQFRTIPSTVFEFEVTASKNTFWSLRDSRGGTLYPALKGRLWLGRQGGRLLRMELEAVRLPSRSEFRTVNITIDYQETRIAQAGTFLLPSKSKADVCISAPSSYLGMSCTSNALVFHDCRKFVVKSHMITDIPGH